MGCFDKIKYMMKLLTMALAFVVAAVASSSSDIKLVTFDGAKGTSFKFTELNDPVMGGKSTGTWSLSSSRHFGVFDGEVVDVPALKAPGFIKAAADGSFSDLSSAAGGSLILSVGRRHQRIVAFASLSLLALSLPPT